MWHAVATRIAQRDINIFSAVPDNRVLKDSLFSRGSKKGRFNWVLTLSSKQRKSHYITEARDKNLHKDLRVVDAITVLLPGGTEEVLASNWKTAVKTKNSVFPASLSRSHQNLLS